MRIEQEEDRVSNLRKEAFQEICAFVGSDGETVDGKSQLPTAIDDGKQPGGPFGDQRFSKEEEPGLLLSCEAPYLRVLVEAPEHGRRNVVIVSRERA
jgi:hypothetical protein